MTDRTLPHARWPLPRLAAVLGALALLSCGSSPTPPRALALHCGYGLAGSARFSARLDDVSEEIAARHGDWLRCSSVRTPDGCRQSYEPELPAARRTAQRRDPRAARAGTDPRSAGDLDRLALRPAERPGAERRHPRVPRPPVTRAAPSACIARWSPTPSTPTERPRAQVSSTRDQPQVEKEQPEPAWRLTQEPSTRQRHSPPAHSIS